MTSYHTFAWIHHDFHFPSSVAGGVSNREWNDMVYAGSFLEGEWRRVSVRRDQRDWELLLWNDYFRWGQSSISEEDPKVLLVQLPTFIVEESETQTGKMTSSGSFSLTWVSWPHLGLPTTHCTFYSSPVSNHSHAVSEHQLKSTPRGMFH